MITFSMKLNTWCKVLSWATVFVKLCKDILPAIETAFSGNVLFICGISLVYLRNGNTIALKWHISKKFHEKNGFISQKWSYDAFRHKFIWHFCLQLHQAYDSYFANFKVLVYVPFTKEIINVKIKTQCSLNCWESTGDIHSQEISNMNSTLDRIRTESVADRVLKPARASFTY